MTALEKRVYENYEECMEDLLDFVSMILVCLKTNKGHEEIKNSIKTLKENMNSSKLFLSPEKLKLKYDFNDLEWICILAATVKKTNHDLKELNYENLAKLWNKLDGKETNVKIQVENLKEKLEPLFIKNGDFEVTSAVYEMITGNLNKQIIPEGTEFFYKDKKSKYSSPLPIREEKCQKIKNFLTVNNFKKMFLFLIGNKGIGKKTIVKRTAMLLNKNLILIDLKKFISGKKDTWLKKYKNFIYLNKDQSGLICFENFDDFFETNSKNTFLVLSLAKEYFGTIFILGNNKDLSTNFRDEFFCMDIPIESLSETENLKLWEFYIQKNNDITEANIELIANKFQFTPLQIKNTILDSKKIFLWKNLKKLDEKEFSKCACKQGLGTLSDKAKLIKKNYTWDDLILGEKTKMLLKQICDRVKYRNVVYKNWGLSKKILYGKGLSAMFYGSSGTGKTMAAGVIADELGLDLYKVDVARVVSKYIGETEKNLKEIFDEAKKSSVILLFDEADSFFAKRTEVKDSHDRNANVETAFLLQQMEDFDGITILTTNMDKNIDDAFRRRLKFQIDFPKPEVKERQALWNRFFVDSAMPLENDVDFNYLVNHFEFSGGDMVKIATTAAFLAASKEEKIAFKHILNAIKTETTHKTASDFGKYQYLVK